MRKVLLFVFVSFITSLAYNETPVKITGYKLENPIILDGKLTEKVWDNPIISNFVQADPQEGKPASEKTEVWIAYDNANLYVAAKLHDSAPESIDASMARRDNYVDSDWFYFYVDPFLDRRTGYYFAVNAGGSMMDGTIYNDSWDDDSWDGKWEAKTNLNDDGWMVEFKIPFSQLRFRSMEEMEWGVNFQRRIKRKQERDYFVMVPKDQSGFVSHFAILSGLNGVKPSNRIEVIPYFVQKAQYLQRESGDPFYKSNQYKTSFGADFKIGIGSNLNINATINPDFGQVEVDPAVVNLSAFETFFPEKRSFFIEGSEIFYFGFGGVNNNWGFNFGSPEFFYSRRIGRSPQGDTPDNEYENYPSDTRILGAAKLTGKIGENFTVGALSAATERTYAEINSNGEFFDHEVEPFTHYGVLRGSREFDGGNSALGFIFTSVNRDLRTPGLESSLSEAAYVGGIDGYKIFGDDDQYAVNFAAAGSHTRGTKDYLVELQEAPYRYFQRPDAESYSLDSSRTSLSGYYTRMMFNKQKGNFYINSAFGMVSPGFEYNDLGFQWMGDRINAHTVLGYRWFKPGKIFRKKSFYFSHFRNYNFDGDITNNGLMLFTNFQFLNYYTLDFRPSYNFEDYNQTLTRGGPLVRDPSVWQFSLDISSDTRKKVIYDIDGNYAVDKLGSYYYEYGFDVVWKPSAQVSFSVGPEFSRHFEKLQWVDSFSDPFAQKTFGKRYVFGEIDQKTIAANIRLNWTFTPTLSLQLFVQPLISVGNYSRFKELAEPGTRNFNIYEDNGGSISFNAEDEEYTIDPDGNGDAEPFTFENPDFNFKSLRGNLVLRWEVMPGSIFYFVWTHDKSNTQYPGDFKFQRDLKNLWFEEPDNIFLMKFNYWFNL